MTAALTIPCTACQPSPRRPVRLARRAVFSRSLCLSRSPPGAFARPLPSSLLAALVAPQLSGGAPFGSRGGSWVVPGVRPLAREVGGRFSVVAGTLVIKVTAGKDEPERCNQAFTVAASAVVSGVRVSLWLTGESAWFALPGRAADFALPHAAPLEDLLAAVLAAGTITVCTQCAA